MGGVLLLVNPALSSLRRLGAAGSHGVPSNLRLKSGFTRAARKTRLDAAAARV